MTDAERLAAFEAVGEKLWPYVRHFALAGANPDAIEVVVELGQLLGKSADGQQSLAAAQYVRDELLKQVVAWLNGSQLVRAKTGARIASEIATLLQEQWRRDNAPPA